MRRKNHRGLRQLLIILALTGSLAALIAVFGGAEKPAAGSSTNQAGFIDIGGIFPLDIGIISFPEVTTTLTVGASGGGSGTITTPTAGNDGNGLNCTVTAGVESGDCSDSYTWTLVAPIINLSFNPAVGSVFAGSTCGGTAVMTDNVNCQGTFDVAAGTFPVNVTTAGVGDGSITGPGINCVRTAGVQSGDCSESYLSGTAVTLNASPAGSSTFGSFSGDCLGPVCNLTVNAAKALTGTFNATTFPLTVDIQGSGNGVVTSSSAPGIACVGNAGVDSGDCSENYAANTNITLQATPAAGSTFVGSWGGACAAFGSNPTCVVSMTAPQAVTASFALAGGGGGGGCTINGTNGADVLNGTAGADVICGKRGNDVINGKGGADTLRGDRGADVINGGNGPDRMFGANGADVLRGGTGVDTANGGGGIDICAAEVKISCP